ncbi:hypothetical protein EPUS_01317 [Endocarpon pusillum Z07020]|uniref:Thioesterase domain-containing protein n=1 Tax=Endocarpon pusillum (strain Z07020 / HMAS-L-300199) TaxID=1263415 RepID=U1GV74_ENDPU|nr:uncharacterized protein EPUS_01317 [Endocarpon pusillum Z07020]ERF75951.1 hypothetical protein EPUS_01317 [Endocarpon pusillum Z07020]
MALTFSDIAPIQPLTTHTYSTIIEDSWNIGSVPHGGYTTSIFLVVARKHMTLNHPSRNQSHPINLHLEFLRRTSASTNTDSTPATFTVRDLKLGSRVSNLHITLSQPNGPNHALRDNVEGYIIMSNLHTERGLTLPTSFTLHPTPPSRPSNFSALESNSGDENWILYPPSAIPAFRKAAQHIRIYLPRPEIQPRSSAGTAKNHLDQWVRFHPEGRPGSWTNDSLGFVVDMFPPIVAELFLLDEADAADAPSLQIKGKVGTRRRPRARFWYPTLSLNLEVKKALPEPDGVEWLFVRVSATVIRNGRMDLQVLVLDAEAEVVAISSHVALMMGTERNLAGRTSRI